MEVIKMYAEKLGLDTKMEITERDKLTLERVLTDNGEFEAAGLVAQMDSAADLEIELG